MVRVCSLDFAVNRRANANVATALALAVTLGLWPIQAWGKSPRELHVDLARARELDALGVRAYQTGRAREAMLLFREAYRLGGPSIELWNVARCHQRLEEDQEAAAVLEQYLADDHLLPSDRAQAERELAEIRRKPSSLIVGAHLAGASVWVDGKKVGLAPLATEVTQGRHVVRLELDGKSGERVIEARFARPVAIRAMDDEDERDRDEDRDADDAGSSASDRFSGETYDSNDDSTGDGRGRRSSSARRLELDVQGGVYAYQLGSVSGRVGPGGTVGLRLGVGRRPLAGFLSLRGELFELGWASSTTEVAGASGTPTGGCTFPSRYRAASAGGAVGGGLAWDATRTVRGSVELGVGAETVFLGRAGGDAFNTTCSASPGVVPVGSARAEVSFRLAGATRVVLTPIAFAIHPAYDGARSAPSDASGAWLRIGATLGLSYDFLDTGRSRGTP